MNGPRLRNLAGARTLSIALTSNKSTSTSRRQAFRSNGTKLSNPDGARTLPWERIQVDEKRCVAGSVVFEKCMQGNAMRFSRPDPFLPQSSAVHRPESGSKLNRRHPCTHLTWCSTPNSATIFVTVLMRSSTKYHSVQAKRLRLLCSRTAASHSSQVGLWPLVRTMSGTPPPFRILFCTNSAASRCSAVKAARSGVGK